MNKFMHDNKFYIGANYWASHNSINMWADWNAEAVEEDFRKLSSHHIKTLRMFITWDVFQPLRAIMANMTVYEYRMMPGEKPLPDTEAGRAGVSEEACGHFKEFCTLADKYGIKLIVGLLTGHMSFRYYCPEAFLGKNPLADPTVMKWEMKFVRYFVKRFRDEPSIVAWDLGNECSNLAPIQPDQGYVWTQAITSAIRESDPTRPVVSGYALQPLDHEAFNIRDTAEIVDITTTHPYQIFSSTGIDPINSVRAEIDPAVRATIYETMGNKPAFVEEVGSIGYTNNSEKTEAEFLKTMLWSTWSQGNHGCFWWCAFDQGQFDYAPYDWNNYGSDYGFFRADGSEKPIAKVANEFGEFLENFEYAELPRHTEEAVCIVPREVKDPLKLMNSVFILAKQANLDLRFVHAEDKLPDSKLYILPSVFSGKPIFLHRLNELLDKVRAGASLYFSLGDTLFRRLPELTGLTIAAREHGGQERISLGKDTFTLGGNYRYDVESVADSCTVLAYGEDGRPVFVRNSYGKGNIYFLTFPLEWQISDRPGIFKDETCAPYYRFYEKFAADADTRAVKSLNPCVLTTEHILADNRRLIIAINYSGADKQLNIELRNGWKITRRLVGNEVVKAHDAVIFEVKK